jgi:hypothetical protein
VASVQAVLVVALAVELLAESYGSFLIVYHVDIRVLIYLTKVRARRRNGSRRNTAMPVILDVAHAIRVTVCAII